MAGRWLLSSLLPLLLLGAGCDGATTTSTLADAADAASPADVGSAGDSGAIGRPLDASQADAPARQAYPTLEEEPRLFKDFGPDLCGPAATDATVGFDEGQRLGRVFFKDCEGRLVSLQQFCGADALWVFFAHGWCPHCQKASGFMEEVWASYPDRNLAAVNVLVQTSVGGVPDAASCKQWRQDFGFEGTITLYDDSKASDQLWDAPYTALNVFVDRQQVVVRKVHTDVEEAIRAQLDTLLDVAR